MTPKNIQTEIQQLKDRVTQLEKLASSNGIKADLYLHAQHPPATWKITNEPKQQKPSVVNFYRFHRPIDPKTGLVDSSKGVTMYVEIDYKVRLVRASFAVCNGDNFNKEAGKLLAIARMRRGDWIRFSLDEFYYFESSLTRYIAYILNDSFYGSREFEVVRKQLNS